MQPWDIVTVQGVDNDYDGKAGIVLRVKADKAVAVVKLDEVPEPLAFAYAELTVLGR
mgnify:CR=1 FL=1